MIRSTFASRMIPVVVFVGVGATALAQEANPPSSDAAPTGLAETWASVQDLWREIDAVAQAARRPSAALNDMGEGAPAGFESIDDAYLALMAKAHRVLSSLPEGDGEASALSKVVRARLWGVTRGKVEGGGDMIMAGVVRARVVVMRNGMQQKVEEESKDPSEVVKQFEGAIDPASGLSGSDLRDRLKQSLDDMDVCPEGGAAWRLGRTIALVEALARGGGYPARPEASPETLAEVTKLVGDLGSADFAVRDAATARLQELGEVAVPALREALKSEDPEVRARASQILGEE